MAAQYADGYHVMISQSHETLGQWLGSSDCETLTKFHGLKILACPLWHFAAFDGETWWKNYCTVRCYLGLHFIYGWARFQPMWEDIYTCDVFPHWHKSEGYIYIYIYIYCLPCNPSRLPGYQWFRMILANHRASLLINDNVWISYHINLYLLFD